MKYFETFAGVGGFTIGIEKAYADHSSEPKKGDTEDGRVRIATGEAEPDAVPVCVGFSEIDRHASAVLRYRFPNVPNYGDIQKIDWAAVPDFDLLVGGSPCQDFSVAGKRAGLVGARSGLAYEYVRALEEKRPAHFVWENVKGVLSSNRGWDFAAILNQMAEAGYSLWWQVLNAKDFGVPQNRERVFVVGTRSDLGSPREVFFEAGDGGKDISKTLRANYGTGFTPKRHGGDKQVVMAVDTKQPGPPRFSKDSPTLQANGWKEPIKMTDGTRIRRLMPVECERLMSWPDDWTLFGDNGGSDVAESVYMMSDTQRYKMCGNGVVSDVVAAVIKAHFL